MENPADLQETLGRHLQARPQAVRFRRQARLWILLPLLLGALGLGAFVALLGANEVGSFSAWADASLIFLLIPIFLFGILTLALLAGLVYVFIAIIRWIPQPAYKIETALRRVDRAAQRASKVVSRPFMFPSALAAAISQVFHSIASIFQNGD